MQRDARRHGTAETCDKHDWCIGGVEGHVLNPGTIAGGLERIECGGCAIGRLQS